MHPALTPQQGQAIAEALYAGNKIAAIKQFREISGQGLKESKEVIDRLEHDLRVAHPERFKVRERSKYGCLVFTLLLIFVIGAVLWKWLAG